MLRVLVNAEDAVRREIAGRLRGGTVVADGGDVVAVVGAACSDVGQLETHLGERRHLLLATESSLPLAALEHLAALARGQGVQLSVVNPDRHLPSRLLIRQQLEAGKLGEVGLVRMHRWQPPGGRVLLVRDLELAAWYVGRAPNLVYAVGPTADHVQVHLGFPGGAMALVGHAGLPSGPAYQALSIIGSAGAAYADDHQNTQLVFQGGAQRARRTGEGTKQAAALVQEFVDALGSGRDMSPSLASWRGAWSVLAAVERSRSTRQAIVPEGL